MSGLSGRDELYNAILKTVKEHGEGKEIGLIRAVLGEVDSAIASKANCNSFDTVREKLEERTVEEGIW